jgi:hypothetical protein
LRYTCRQFLDAQLEVFIQLMTRLYNLGAEVHQVSIG